MTKKEILTRGGGPENSHYDKSRHEKMRLRPLGSYGVIKSFASEAFQRNYDKIDWTPKCVLCSSKAVARFITPEGCICRPNDREQNLCAQHIIKDGMIGNEVKCVEIYNKETADKLQLECVR